MPDTKTNNDVKFSATLCILTAAILCSGCVPAFQTTKRPHAIQFIPPPSDANSNPEILLLRYDEWAQFFVNYTIVENDKMIGLITPGSYLHWQTSPGFITISYRPVIPPRCYKIDKQCLGREETTIKIDTRYAADTFDFKVEKNRTYYLHFKPHWFLLTDVPRGADISIVEKAELSKLKAADVKKIKLK